MYIQSIVRLFAIATLMFLGACAYDNHRSLDRLNTLYLGADGSIVSKSSEPPKDTISYWEGDGVSGSPSIVIRLGEQAAYFYKGEKLVGISAISTGREGNETPKGRFKIIQKDKDHHSSLYGDYVDAQGNVVVANVDSTRDPKPKGAIYVGAPMPYFMRIYNGVGMHQGYLPGIPDSHGCIRMPRHMAQAFFANVTLGTPVTVTN